MSRRRLFIGCAGWAIPAAERPHFPGKGTHLERYAARFSAVEINSSFYRPHRPTTYSRWADSVPDGFRFSVKVPKAITHKAGLRDAGSLLAAFLESCSHLGNKLGCLLVQLPPSLTWEADVASVFFRALRDLTDVDVCCEPRHRSWISEESTALFARHRITRVIADPSPIPEGALQNPRRSPVYNRLHGSPKMYYSSYEAEYLKHLAKELRAESRGGRTCWCIFDNTAAGAATRNALELKRYVE